MENKKFVVRGNYVDVVRKRIFKAEIWIENHRILSVQAIENAPDVYILPGIVDAHVHIESSMLVPQEFARIAVKHGTVATVSDPHEIANVMGVAGVDFMIDDASKVPFKFYFGAPSCVPATSFETSGFELSSSDVRNLLQKEEIKYLSEMMNFPGVIYNDAEVHQKLQYARDFNKPVDGHAPGLSGESLAKYALGGISSDHESVTVAEAIEKIKLAIKLQIRDGSAAKNFEALASVIDLYPNDVMLCTDDCHPDDLVDKHILDLVKRGVAKGIDLFNLLRAATYNPIKHYKLDVGMLQLNDKADFVVVGNLIDFNVIETYIDGIKVFGNGVSYIKPHSIQRVNNFNRTAIVLDDLSVLATGNDIKVIMALDGDLYTTTEIVKPKVLNNYVVSDIENDILKIVVVNRYNNSKPIVGFIKNIGIIKGALAQSVAHDSHNIIAVGVKDTDILKAINEVIKDKGGIVAVSKDEIYSLSLPVAGLMSDENGEVVAEKYKVINSKPKEWGSKLHSPFMTLSFMALLVIPELKIGDKGLFDGKNFKLTSLFVD